ncbi:MAG TPA: porin family protein [Bacteroidota bacterium]
MKRFLVVCGIVGGLLLMAYGPADAQVRFGFGPRVGFNLGGMSFDPDASAQNPNVSKTGRFGMMFGAAGEIEFARMFAAELGLLFAMKGGGFQTTGATLDEKFSELEIPILFKVKIPVTPNFRPYGFLGPNLGFILSATETLTNQRGTSDTDLKNVPGEGSLISSLDFSLDFGGGAEYLISRNIGLQGDVRYSLGLSNIFNEPPVQGQVVQPQQTRTWKTHGLQILFGMNYYP